MKKRMLAIILAAMLILTLSSCTIFPHKGGDENDTKQYSESDYENIVMLYQQYLDGEITEAELMDEAEYYGITSIYGLRAIYAERGGDLGYDVYGGEDTDGDGQPDVIQTLEASSAIEKATFGDPIIQIGDTVVRFPCTLGSFMKATGAKFADVTEAAQNDLVMLDYKREYSLQQDFKSLDATGDGGHVFLKTKEGGYLGVYIGAEGGAVDAAKNLYITEIFTGSDKVYFAGGIRVGMDRAKINDAAKNATPSGYELSWSEADGYINGRIARFTPYINIRLDTATETAYRISSDFETP